MYAFFLLSELSQEQQQQGEQKILELRHPFVEQLTKNRVTHGEGQKKMMQLRMHVYVYVGFSCWCANELSVLHILIHDFVAKKTEEIIILFVFPKGLKA